MKQIQIREVEDVVPIRNIKAKETVEFTTEVIKSSGHVITIFWSYRVILFMLNKRKVPKYWKKAMIKILFSIKGTK